MMDLRPWFAGFSSRVRKGSLLGLLLLCVSCQTTVDNPTSTGPTPVPIPTETDAQSVAIDPNSIDAFRELLNQAESRKADERQPLIDSYIAHLQSSPITEDNQALFIWRGEAFSVQLVGDMNNWEVEDAPYFKRLEGTDLWYLEIEFEEDARLDYKIAVDTVGVDLDPLNPRTMTGGFGPNSELVMPSYTAGDELLPSDGSIPTGELIPHTLDSTILGQTRTFFVYVPAGQIVGAKTPSIYINDGGDYLNLIDATAILDKLIAERKIPPLVAVFIPPLNRNSEYSLNDDYANFLADELVPFIRRTYDTDPDPSRTGTLGASLGGLTSVYTAMTRSDVFGLAAGQSGAYSVNDDALIRRVQSERLAFGIGGPARRDIRIFLVVGLYETAVSGDHQNGNLLAANRRLVDALKDSEHEFVYEERPEGHSWGLWRGTFGQALGYLFTT
jgi:enterochelin esterase family protein